MSPDLIVILIFVAIFLIIGGTYFLHGRKIEKNKAKAKQQPKQTEEKAKIEESNKDEEPVPVGIIKQEILKSKEEFDMAPLKEPEKPAKEVDTKPQTTKQTLPDEIKNLSPEMKKVLMSDLLKPKY